MARKLALADMVQKARERMFARGTGILRWHMETYALTRRRAKRCAKHYRESVDEVCDRARLGFYFCPPIDLADDIKFDHPLDDLNGIVDCPLWLDFHSVARLTTDVDCFLAVMESDPQAASLALACREDLDTLPILADLCEDTGLPHAAREARHLHEKVRHAL